MKNLKISHRISLAFAAFLLMLLGLVAFSLSQMRAIQSSLEIGLRGGTEDLTRVAEMQSTVVSRSIASRNILFMNGQGELTKQTAALRTLRQQFATLLAAHSLANGESAGLTRVRESAVQFDKQTERLAAYAKDKANSQPNSEVDSALAELAGVQQSEMVSVVEQQLVPAEAQVLRALDLLILEANAQSKQPLEQASALYQSARGWLITLAVVAFGLGGLIAWRIAMGLIRPIRKAMFVAQDIAQGDLTADIQVRSADESGALFRALHEMQQALQAIATQIKTAANTLSLTTEALATDRADLAQRTEEQAATIEQTSVTMQTFRDSIRANALRAQRASEAALTAQQMVRQGGEAIDRVTTSMQSMSSNTQRVGEITAMIDAISFQTNILALNAAVEAARAGDHGRGFAVVASEVRRLAQQCTSAAKEIRELIGVTLTSINVGANEVREASATILTLVETVQAGTAAMSEVAHSSKEQASGVEEVSRAVSQLEKVTQQNSALVDRSQANVEALQVQAQALVSAVTRFRLKQYEDAVDAPDNTLAAESTGYALARPAKLIDASD